MKRPVIRRHGRLTLDRDRVVKSFVKPLDDPARGPRRTAIASSFTLYFVNKCERRTVEG
jgi:hypothetical protein